MNRMFDSYFNAIKEITGEEHHSVNLISVEFNNLMVMIKEFNKKVRMKFVVWYRL